MEVPGELFVFVHPFVHILWKPEGPPDISLLESSVREWKETVA